MRKESSLGLWYHRLWHYRNELSLNEQVLKNENVKFERRNGKIRSNHHQEKKISTHPGRWDAERSNHSMQVGLQVLPRGK